MVHLITRLKITRLISSTHRYPFERKIKSGFCQNKFNIYIIGVAHPSICRRIHKKKHKDHINKIPVLRAVAMKVFVNQRVYQKDENRDGENMER